MAYCPPPPTCFRCVMKYADMLRTADKSFPANLSSTLHATAGGRSARASKHLRSRVELASLLVRNRMSSTRCTSGACRGPGWRLKRVMTPLRKAALLRTLAKQEDSYWVRTSTPASAGNSASWVSARSSSSSGWTCGLLRWWWSSWGHHHHHPLAGVVQGAVPHCPVSRLVAAGVVARKHHR